MWSRVLFAAGCGAVMLLAADPWKDKPVGDWADKDVHRLLTKSPWAKEVAGNFNAERMGRTGIPGGGRPGGWGGGRGGMGGGGMGMPGGGMGGPGGGMGGPGGGMGGPGAGGGMGGPGGGSWGGSRGGPAGEVEGGGRFEPPKFTVRWESAAPVREASERDTTDLRFKIPAEWTEKFYVITVTGMQNPQRQGGWQGRGEGQQPDPSRADAMRDRMKQVTFLRPKGKDPVAPERVESMQTPQGRTLAFLFPRTLGEDDKEVAFETAFGPMEIRTKFELKEMTYRGHLSL